MRKLGWTLMLAAILAGSVQGAGAQGAGVTDKKAEVVALEAKGDKAQLKKDFALAVAYYSKALKNDRENAVLYNKLGIAELRMDNHGQARKNFSKSLKYDPNYFTAMNNLGVVDILDKRYKQAVVSLKQALALDEENAHTHVNLAEAWMGLGEVARAMTEYTRALQLDADVLSSGEGGAQAQVYTTEQRARIDFLIAKLFVQRNNLGSALEYLSRAKEMNYPDLHQVYSDQAFAPLWNDPRLAKIVKK